MFPKKKRSVYEKEFTLYHVSQNLQGYRLATGDVDQRLLNESRQVHGDDEGRVLGALIAGVGKSHGPNLESHLKEDMPSSSRKRTRKRRTRNRNPASVSKSNTQKVSASKLNFETSEPLLTGTPAVRKVCTPTIITSLDLLAAYRNSSSSNDDSDDSKDTKRLPVPGVIQDMFQEERLPGEEEPEDHKESISHLGYFEAESFLSDEVQDPVLRSRVPPDHPTNSGAGAVCRKWNEEKGQWVFGESVLSSYTCWKCNNVGHLAKDCTVVVAGGQTTGSVGVKITKSLQALYATCREIKGKKGQWCSDCGMHSNLACCLECRSVLCDGRGHLASHLLEHPTHHMLYSFKLGRLLKCCKSTCEVVNVYDLLICSHCLGKAFSQHYSMINAIWSVAGLRKIPNAMCCEEHFQWHRMNCPNVCDEVFITEEKLNCHSNSTGLLSEFYF